MKHSISQHRLRNYCRALLSVAICSAVCISYARSYAQKNFVTPDETTLRPPKTRVEAVTETLHGITVSDPYRWLEDQNSPETREWINGQIAYTQSILSTLPGRESIRRRLEQLIKIDTISPPFERGGRYFFSKRLADQDQPIIYVRENGADSVLIDPKAISSDPYTSVGLQDISSDGKIVVYGIRKGGKDEVEIKILDVETRKEFPDRLPEARYFGISLTNDKVGLYYSKYGPEGSRIFYHKIGSEVSEDRKIFGDGYGPGEIIGASLSEDGRYLIIAISYGSSSDKTDIYIQDLKTGGAIVPIVKDIKASFSSSGVTSDGHFFLETNLDAPNKRVIDIDLNNSARENWRTVIPEGKTVIDSSSLIGGKLFVNYLENVHSRVSLYDRSGKHLRDINLPALGTVNGPFGRVNSDEAFYTFNSFVQPTTIFRYDSKTGKQQEWARIKVPLESRSIEVKQVFYPSKDKTMIPMFLVYKKGIKLDGLNPTYLTGYGGFNISLSPNFSPSTALWVEHGGVFALSNLRGGGEFGEEWHKAGMLANKQNVFDDFISAAEWLINNKYTNSSRLSIAGGSNGGLLVGAAFIERPELFRAVICSVPLLDMVRYHMFLVAKFWVPEYGSSEDAEQFGYIYKYSPYHHVVDGVKYPSVLFFTGDSDTRVAPLHARKMTARLQAATGSDLPVLLHYYTKVGHSGGQPTGKQVEDLTDQMSYLFWQLGMK